MFVRKETRVFVFEESINKMCKLLPIFEIIVFVSGKFLTDFIALASIVLLVHLIVFVFGASVSFPFLEIKWVIAFISIGT